MRRIFIANRGEIASRVTRTAQESGLTVAVAHPECDANLPYVRSADHTVLMDSPRGFLDADALLRWALESGADAVHPGYGFLSENAEFARKCNDAGLTFIGPSPEVIASMGDKASARELAAAHGVPTASGSAGAVNSVDVAHDVAATIGFPVMVKAMAGGGGIGMAIARDPDELDVQFESVVSRGATVFGDGRVIVERYIERSRHIEVQIMGLPDGRIVTLGERECSVQRRHQKVVEESPSPALDSAARAHVRELARRMGEAVGYRNAGTVEFIRDTETGDVFFLEMNTRLQVEHPITEAVHGVDLVAWQVDIACGSSELPAELNLDPQGHAFEFRVYAEDSHRFLPKPGRITTWAMPEGDGIRVDAGYAGDTTVTPFFDPMMAKIIVFGADRESALAASRRALATTRIDGPGSNLEFLARVVENPDFISGDYDTGLVGAMSGT